MHPSPAHRHRGATPAVLLTSTLLLLGGLALVMGGAVRWLGCLTPDLWAADCPMHDDAFAELPGIDLPVAVGYALLGAAAVPASIGLRPAGRRGWAVPVLGLLTLAVYLAFAVGTLMPGARRPGEPASALLGASSLLVQLVPLLSVTGAALVALGRDGEPVRPAARWTGWTLVAIGLAHGIVPFVLLNSVSNSHDDPPGLFLLPGLATLVLAGLLLAVGTGSGSGGRASAVAAVLAGTAALLTSAAWAAAGAILWRACLEPGEAEACTPGAADAARAPLERELWPTVTPQPDTAVQAGVLLLVVAAGAALLHAARARTGAAVAQGAGAVVCAAAGAILAARTGGAVLGEVAFAVVVAALGMALLWQAGRTASEGAVGS